MKICSFCFFALLILMSLQLNAQTSEVYIPKEFKSALNEGARTQAGVPGPNYWQNSADYVINVEILPDSSLLQGSAKITYYNNSPDSLDKIILRLYQNILRPEVGRDWQLSAQELTEGVVIKLLDYQYPFPETTTQCKDY